MNLIREIPNIQNSHEDIVVDVGNAYNCMAPHPERRPTSKSGRVFSTPPATASARNLASQTFKEAENACIILASRATEVPSDHSREKLEELSGSGCFLSPKGMDSASPGSAGGATLGSEFDPDAHPEGVLQHDLG